MVKEANIKILDLKCANTLISGLERRLESYEVFAFYLRKKNSIDPSNNLFYTSINEINSKSTRKSSGLI